MSDRDLRRILNDIIEDLDSGRLRPHRPRRLVRWIGGPALAASLGLGLGLGATGCDDRAIGYAEDAGVHQVDTGVHQADTGMHQVDAGSTEDYAAPPVDAGGIYAYGIPPMVEDAGAEAIDAGAEEWDGGAYDLYGVPFEGEDAAVDPPPEAMYAAPDMEIEPSPDAGPAPDPDPDPDPK